MIVAVLGLVCALVGRMALRIYRIRHQRVRSTLAPRVRWSIAAVFFVATSAAGGIGLVTNEGAVTAADVIVIGVYSLYGPAVVLAPLAVDGRYQPRADTAEP